MGGLLSACVLTTSVAHAQLVVSEIMFDPRDDTNWEWLELHNQGTSDIDLEGYYISRLNTRAILPTDPPHISAANGTSTVIPAGATAVLYHGERLGFDGQRFRNAWGLSSRVPLIGVESFPSLPNTGTAFGFWPNLNDYLEDTAFDPDFSNGTGRDYTSSFDHATFSFDYTPSAFPNGNNSASIAWNGGVPVSDPANWSRSDAAAPGVLTSQRTTNTGVTLNSAEDVGNPGTVPAGPMRSGLLISEIQFNPRFGTSASNDPPWEWIEVVNNTGQPIDFTETPYVFDDLTTTPVLTTPNITSGRIEVGAVAILFDDSLDPNVFRAAWNTTDLQLNLIPVASYPTLNNDSDTIALWSDFVEYQTDRAQGGNVFDHAQSVVAYRTGAPWPGAVAGASLFALDLSLDTSEDPTNPTHANNWSVSSVGDTHRSRTAQAVYGETVDHEGGDVGSPGTLTFPTSSASRIDFNEDQAINTTDIDALVAAIVAVKSGGTSDIWYDVNQNGSVGMEDLDLWLGLAASAHGFAAPFLLGDLNLDGAVTFPDFVSLNNKWQMPNGLWTGGDLDASGMTNFADFVSLNNNWQSELPRAGSMVAVPEPAAIPMWVGLCVGQLFWRRNR
jgi:hypothetical protein